MEFRAGAIGVVLTLLILLWRCLEAWSLLESLRTAVPAPLIRLLDSPLTPLVVSIAAIGLIWDSRRRRDAETRFSVHNVAESNPTQMQTTQVFVGNHVQPATAERKEKKKEESPSLSYIQARTTLIYEAIAAWHEVPTQMANRPLGCHALVVDFKNVARETGHRTPTANSVRASLTFRSPEEVHINHGTWLDYYENAITFKSGDSHSLVVALQPEKNSLVTIDNPRIVDPYRKFTSGGTIMPTRQVDLPVGHGQLEVTLVDGLSRVTVFSGVFDYLFSDIKMTLKPRIPSSP